MAIAVVPCLALFGSGAVAVLVLTDEARTTQKWAEYFDQQMDPVVTFLAAVQDERLQSMLASEGDLQAHAALATVRAKTDAVLAELGRIAPLLQELNPQAATRSAPAFYELATQTPTIRRSVDLGQSDIRALDDFYRTLPGIISFGLRDSASYTPDAATAVEQMTAADLVDTVELHSRAVAVAAATTSDGRTLGLDERQAVTELVGAHRQRMDTLAARLTDDGRKRLNRLTESSEWRTASAGEDALIEKGVLAVAPADWLAAERAVDTELIALFRGHAIHANTLASAAADRSFDRSVWAGLGVTILAFGAFTVALVLANRLVERLRSLRSRTLELANETLPSMVARLNAGQQVDIERETATLDNRADEIGEVAAAFGIAQRVAMIAAASEARTRDGFNKVFLDIAHRSQLVVKRQLDVLDIAEAKQDDPEHLELLFQLDHLATRARRNAENLLILGGGQPGRRWRDPVELEQIVRSAVSETHDLSRVSAIRLPQARVVGHAVADLIHLLAELVDNATHFSPPQSLVSIHGNLVGRGVVIEIEDQGLGIQFDERERLNELLRVPQGFQEMALAGERHLGLFVVSRLANRHSVTVNLQESAYGGVKAIVLLPSAMLDLASDHSEPDTTKALGVSPRRAIESALAPPPEQVPRLRESTEPQLPPWPGDELSDKTERDISRSNSRDNRTPPAARTSRHRAELPRRHKQANLAPELQAEDESPENLQQPHDNRRPAREIRRSMESFQRGTFQARTSTPHLHHQQTDGPAQ